MDIDPRLIELATSLVEGVVGTALFGVRDPQRGGGQFCMTRRTGELVTNIQVLRVRPEKRRRYCDLALEKPFRLGQYEDDLSSFESRCPEKDEWGGAIRMLRCNLGFSGMPTEQ